MSQDLVDEAHAYANKRGLTLAALLALCIGPDEGVSVFRVDPDAVTAHAIVEPGEDTRQTAHGMLVYDTSKYVLGKLCPRGHDYHSTGQSLLRLSNRHCLACDREKFHERKQAKLQAQPA